MRNPQWLLLLFSVVTGMFWIFIGQNWIFLNLFPGLLAGPGLNLVTYLETGSSPAFSMFWAGCIAALLVWIGVTWSSRPHSSAQTREMQPKWWVAAGLLTLFGWCCLSWFTTVKWVVSGISPIEGATNTFYPIPAGGWVLMMGFVLLDVILLFWLPTLLASPRTYRFVVPGSVTLLGSR